MENFKKWLLLEKDHIDRQIRNYPKFRILLFLSAIFGFLVSLFWFWGKTNSLPIKSADSLTLHFLSRIQNPSLTKFFSFLTILGTAQFIFILFIILGVILVLKRRKRVAMIILLALIGSGLINVFLRNFLFGRLRPNGCIPAILGMESCFSFPSGHAVWSFYFYGLLDYLVFRFLPISLKRYLLISLVIAVLIILISMSRIYLGVHYLSDIVGGLFFGGAWLTLAILLIDILYSDTK